MFSITACVLLMTASFTSSRAQGTSCSAGFTYSVLQSTIVQFYDSSFVFTGDSITSWAWSFGDGNFSTQQDPLHTYNTAGTYTVCLMITTAMGCSDTTCQVIVLGNPCGMTVSIAYDSSMSTLTASASGGVPPYNYLWSTGQNTQTITVTTSGTYCVTIADNNNCTATGCYTFGSGSQCFANATYTSAGGGTYQFYAAISGNYSSFIWDFGDGSTSTQINPMHTYASPGTYVACITAYDSIGNVCSTYCLTIYFAGSPNDTICGYFFWDTNGNGILDAGENGIAGGIVYIWGNGVQATAQADSNGYYYALVNPGTYTVVYCTNPGNVFTIPLNVDSGGCAYYTAVITNGGNSCGYNFGIQNTAVTITGTLFVDGNSNGVLDAGESGIPYQSVSVGGYTAYSNQSGFYSINVPAGTYNVSYTPSGPYAGYSLTTPGSITVNATTVGNIYGGNDFGLFIPPGSVNLSVNITPHTTVTPGFPAWYDIQVCNIGVMPVGATLTMNYDPGLSFDYANPAQSSINTSTHVITWNLQIIQPGSCAYIWVDFNASTSYNIGDNTFELVFVTPTTGSDIDMSNNTDSIHQIVTGSWDPNNKLSVKTNTSNPNEMIVSSVNPDQSIDYTINFQNTGTAAAVNVVVLDELSPDLDANSFQLTGLSHNGNVTRNGSRLNFQFPNIMLPDMTTNEPASHGFINFRINANNGLPVSHVISDNAAIYFDFNAPVITNYALVTLISPVGLNENSVLTTGLSLYPNPSSDFSNFTYELKENAEVNLELFDASGKSISVLVNELQHQGVHRFRWNAGLVESGLYHVRLTANGKSAFYKLSVF